MSNSTGQETVGDRLQKGQSNALKSIAILIGLIIYVAFLIFSAVHNYSLLTTGIREDLLMWATLGVFTLELSALGLPLALHYWTFGQSHRLWAFIFYALDMVIIILNIVLDFNINALGGRANVTDAWLLFYLDYIAPASPVIPGISWSILFLLDPQFKKKQIQETVAMATLETIGDLMIEQTKSETIREIVATGAAEQAKYLVANTVATILRENGGVLPPRVIDAIARDVTPTRRNAKPKVSLVDRFFGGLNHIADQVDHLVYPDNAPRHNAANVNAAEVQTPVQPNNNGVGENHSGSAGDNGANFTGPAK